MSPRTGIHLNNMLGEEDLNPLGYHMHEPGTRVTSMMAPTLVLKDGDIELSVGSAGSNRIRSAIVQVIRYVVDEGKSVDEAIRRGRIHYENGILHAEPGFEAAALDELDAARLQHRALARAQPVLRRRSGRGARSRHGPAVRRRRPAPWRHRGRRQLVTGD